MPQFQFTFGSPIGGLNTHASPYHLNNDVSPDSTNLDCDEFGVLSKRRSLKVSQVTLGGFTPARQPLVYKDDKIIFTREFNYGNSIAMGCTCPDATWVYPNPTYQDNRVWASFKPSISNTFTKAILCKDYIVHSDGYNVSKLKFDGTASNILNFDADFRIAPMYVTKADGGPGKITGTYKWSCFFTDDTDKIVGKTYSPTDSTTITNRAQTVTMHFPADWYNYTTHGITRVWLVRCKNGQASDSRQYFLLQSAPIAETITFTDNTPDADFPVGENPDYNIFYNPIPDIIYKKAGFFVPTSSVDATSTGSAGNLNGSYQWTFLTENSDGELSDWGTESSVVSLSNKIAKVTGHFGPDRTNYDIAATHLCRTTAGLPGVYYLVDSSSGCDSTQIFYDNKADADLVDLAPTDVGSIKPYTAAVTHNNRLFHASRFNDLNRVWFTDINSVDSVPSENFIIVGEGSTSPIISIAEVGASVIVFRGDNFGNGIAYQIYTPDNVPTNWTVNKLDLKQMPICDSNTYMEHGFVFLGRDNIWFVADEGNGLIKAFPLGSVISPDIRNVNQDVKEFHATVYRSQLWITLLDYSGYQTPTYDYAWGTQTWCYNWTRTGDPLQGVWTKISNSAHFRHLIAMKDKLYSITDEGEIYKYDFEDDFISNECYQSPVTHNQLNGNGDPIPNPDYPDTDPNNPYLTYIRYEYYPLPNIAKYTTPFVNGPAEHANNRKILRSVDVDIEQLSPDHTGNYFLKARTSDGVESVLSQKTVAGPGQFRLRYYPADSSGNQLTAKYHQIELTDSTDYPNNVFQYRYKIHNISMTYNLRGTQVI